MVLADFIKNARNGKGEILEVNFGTKHGTLGDMI